MSQKESGSRRPNQQVAPPSFPPPTCPRCYSENTKFCYYNNYTVSQPRYYCKDCRRYWTHGGALRNIPSGGASRKRGRIGHTTTTASASTSQVLIPPSITWGPSIGDATFRPPIRETMLSFNGGGVNTGLGGVSVTGFGGGASLPPAQTNPLLHHLSSVDGFRGFGFPVHQPPPPPQYHLPPPSLWTTGQGMTAFTNTSISTSTNTSTTILSVPNNFMPNVVDINEWSELNDIDYNEGGGEYPYKPPSP